MERPTKTPSPEAVDAARLYFAHLEDFSGFAQAALTDEFHQHFLTLIDSLSQEQRRLLYEKAQRENTRFAHLLTERGSLIAALSALEKEDIPFLELFGIRVTDSDPQADIRLPGEGRDGRPD
jgi:hypothetical protein